MISNRDIFCLTEISDLRNVPHLTASGPVLSAQDRTTRTLSRRKSERIRGSRRRRWDSFSSDSCDICSVGEHLPTCLSSGGVGVWDDMGRKCCDSKVGCSRRLEIGVRDELVSRA